MTNSYDPNARPYTVPTGEHHFSRDGEYSRRPPEERIRAWAGAKKILALPDDQIQAVPRRNSKVTDYHIPEGSVSHPHGKSNRFLCHHPDHRGRACPCVRRIKRYVEERAA